MESPVGAGPDDMEWEETQMEDERCHCATKAYSIGVDAGSTFSGLSIVQKPTCGHIEYHERPISFLNEPKKFPTRLAASTTSATTPGPESFRILDRSAEAHKDEKELRLFKLLLRESKMPYTPRIAAALDDCRKSNLDPEELNAIYAVKLLLKARQHIGHVEWNSSEVQKNVVISYSSFLGKPSKAFRDHVKKFLDIDSSRQDFVFNYVSEHEAALRFALFSREGILWAIHNRHDPIIVVDCGGVTVDGAIHYSSMDPGISSAKNPYSELGGGVFMDMAVELLVDGQTKSLSEQAGLETEDLELLKESMMDDWHDTIKHQYCPDTFQGLSMRLQDYEVSLNPDDIKNVFSQVINSVDDAVVKLWTMSRKKPRKPEYLFLTGGVFRNAFILREVERKVSERFAGRGPKVLYGAEMKSWEAVTIGASLHNIPNVVLARYAKQDSALVG